MKISVIPNYSGNAITRQYKRNKHFTYAGSVVAGSCLGLANLFNSVDQGGKTFICGALGLVLIKDMVTAYCNLLKIAKPYDEVCKRAKKIYMRK